MPLSSGIPLGILIIIVGAILFSASRYKKFARIVLLAGVIVTALAVILLVLAANSSM